MLALQTNDLINFNPRSPHGERRRNQRGKAVRGISIHAPRTGSDDRADAGERPRKRFQSTLPARGATTMETTYAKTTSEFQSTLPARGATTDNALVGVVLIVFQSTLPARGATQLILMGR